MGTRGKYQAVVLLQFLPPPLVQPHLAEGEVKTRQSQSGARTVLDAL